MHHITCRFTDQVGLLMIALALLASFATPRATGAAGADARETFEHQITKEGAALIGGAVKSPFGWGWSDARVPPSKSTVKGRQVPRRNEIDVRRTAAAGLVLFMAGEQAGDPALTKGATEATRALVAVQQPSGQFPTTGVLSSNAGGHDEPALVPSRAATCAAVALLSTVIRGSETPDPRFVSSLIKAAAWLAKQQTDAGAFPVAHAPAGSSAPTRVVRLDTTDYRDATAALLLASHTLGEAARASIHADDAVTALLAMRVRAADDKSGTLWLPAYRLTGDPLPKSASDAPYAIDTLAAQRSMQTLLAACLLGDPRAPATKAAGEALVAAAKQVDALPRQADGVGWYRYYDLLTRSPAVELEPHTARGRVDVEEAAGVTSDVTRLAETIAAAHQIAANGVAAFVADDAKLESSVLPTARRVSLMLCRLGRGSLATAFPTDQADVPAYLKASEERWDVIEGLLPNDMELKVERLYVLVLRSELEGIR